MRATLPSLVTKAYVDYESAVSTIRSEVLAKKIELPPETKPLDVLLAVGMALVPWEAIAVAALEAMAGPVRETLKARVISDMISRNPLPFSQPTLDDHANNAMAEIAGMLAKPDNLKTAYKAASDGWKEIAKSTVVGSTALQQTLSYLDGCADEASKRTLSGLVGTMSDNQVAAMYAAYSNPNLRQAYVGDLRGRATQFADIMAAAPGAKPTSFVQINAYGRLRWAKVRYNTTSANYMFIAWVPPGMVDYVAGQQQNPGEPLDPGLIANKLPDPVIMQTRIVRMDAWGRIRYAEVGGEDNEIVFRRWIPQDKETEALAQAQTQIGGIDVDPAKVHGLVAPPGR
ncbi:hypothetical protein GCM10022242_02900 [Nocardioides panacisoli]|uniref:Uncharacterized protein n=2 Tax=Nocardioides panacisoli TaxID=627624 RepID=A0ABP7HSF7_9ACTN